MKTYKSNASQAKRLQNCLQSTVQSLKPTFNTANRHITMNFTGGNKIITLGAKLEATRKRMVTTI